MVDPVADLDIFLRGAAVAALLLCAIMLARRSEIRRKALSVASLCVGLCAYLLVSSPSMRFAQGSGMPVLVLIAGVVPVLVYWTAVELFVDDPAFRPWQFALFAGVIGGAWLALVWPPAGMIRGAVVLGLFVHLLYVVIASDAVDLVESRRRFRRGFLAAIATLGVIITMIELSGVDQDLPPWVFAMQAAVFVGLAAAFVIWATQVAPDIWVARRPASGNDLPPADLALANRVQAAMADGAWRQEGLTITGLAQQLNTQEHRLRRAINQGLGHRNFASFVNGFRVIEAQKRLSDPDSADQTILSIAFDVGFASLGPFNRAFRDVTGQTPTQFRRAQLSAKG